MLVSKIFLNFRNCSLKNSGRARACGNSSARRPLLCDSAHASGGSLDTLEDVQETAAITLRFPACENKQAWTKKRSDLVRKKENPNQSWQTCQGEGRQRKTSRDLGEKVARVLRCSSAAVGPGQRTPLRRGAINNRNGSPHRLQNEERKKEGIRKASDRSDGRRHLGPRSLERRKSRPDFSGLMPPRRAYAVYSGRRR